MAVRIHPIRPTAARRDKHPLPGVLIYTDASTSSAILAAVAMDPSSFLSESLFPVTLSEQVDPERFGILPDTAPICGAELLAIVDAIFVLCDFPMCRIVVFYIDNPNTKGAFVKGFSPTPAINRIVRIFWAFAQIPCARRWFGQVPTGRNISDLPTSGGPFPYTLRCIYLWLSYSF